MGINRWLVESPENFNNAKFQFIFVDRMNKLLDKQ